MSQDWADDAAMMLMEYHYEVTGTISSANKDVERTVAARLREAEQRGFKRGVESAAEAAEGQAGSTLGTSAYANVAKRCATAIRALLSEKPEGER